MVKNGSWKCSLDWLTRYSLSAQKTVPMLDPNATDRMVWFDAKR